MTYMVAQNTFIGAFQNAARKGAKMTWVDEEGSRTPLNGWEDFFEEATSVEFGALQIVMDGKTNSLTFVMEYNRERQETEIELQDYNLSNAKPFFSGYIYETEHA